MCRKKESVGKKWLPRIKQQYPLEYGGNGQDTCKSQPLLKFLAPLTVADIDLRRPPIDTTVIESAVPAEESAIGPAMPSTDGPADDPRDLRSPWSDVASNPELGSSRSKAHNRINRRSLPIIPPVKEGDKRPRLLTLRPVQGPTLDLNRGRPRTSKYLTSSRAPRLQSLEKLGNFLDEKTRKRLTTDGFEKLPDPLMGPKTCRDINPACNNSSGVHPIHNVPAVVSV
jgi:hypothetical protein